MCLMLTSSSVTSILFSFENRCQEEPLLPKSTCVRLSGCVARGHHRVIFHTVWSLLYFTVCFHLFLGKTLGRAFHVNTTVNLCRKPGIAQLDTEEQQLVPAPWGRAGKTECEPGLFTKHAPDSCGRTGDNSRIPGWKSFQERLLEAEFMKRSTDGRCAYL